MHLALSASLITVFFQVSEIKDFTETCSFRVGGNFFFLIFPCRPKLACGVRRCSKSDTERCVTLKTVSFLETFFLEASASEGIK